MRLKLVAQLNALSMKRTFNSIKVRLKRDTHFYIVASISFNSIKVRLKLTRQEYDKEVEIFQFHKGAIETFDGSV